MSTPEDATAALRAIGTTVKEDFFFLKPANQGHQCVASMCRFPSGWDPSSKLGKHMNQIHATVPGCEKIELSIEKYFRKLESGKSVKRQNVSLRQRTQSIGLIN
jgi:hypothetical protein